MPYRGILVESIDRIWLNTIQVLFLSNFVIQIISITVELKKDLISIKFQVDLRLCRLAR